MRVYTLVLLVAAFAPRIATAGYVTGTLPSSTTWTVANSPYTFVRTVTVPAGLTLTIEPGVELIFEEDSNGTRLRVEGTLRAEGTEAAPIRLDARRGFGINVPVGGTATLRHMTITAGRYGIDNKGTTTADHVTVQEGATCLQNRGTLTFNDGVLDSCAWEGLEAIEGTVSLSSNLIRRSGGSAYFGPGNAGEDTHISAVLYVPSTGSGQVTLAHNTIVDNGTFAVKSDGTATLTARDNVLARNGFYKYAFSRLGQSHMVLSYNDVWETHSSLYSNVTAGIGSLTVDPKFVGPTDYRLRGDSPVRGRASDGTDMGAFQYVVPTLARIQVQTQSVPGGLSRQMTASAYDASNTKIDGVTFTWAVDAAAGTIDSTGMLKGGCTPGSYANAVRASAGGVTGSATVIITAPESTLSISPASVGLRPGRTQQFSAVLKDSCGAVSSPSVDWAVGWGDGTIDATGRFTAGHDVGESGYISCNTADGKLASASIYVEYYAPAARVEITPSSVTLASGGIQTFVATAEDAEGYEVRGDIAWSVVNGGGIIDTDGVFEAGGEAGTFADTVRATLGSASATATVTVEAGAVGSVTVSPSPISLLAGETQQFTATVRDAAGHTIPATVSWRVANGGGSISSSGLFTAGSVLGTFTNTVVATSGGSSGSATVVVERGALTSLVVSPGLVTVTAGATQQFTATGQDASGNTVPADVTWRVTNGGGSISSSGLFTAGSATDFFYETVVATSGAISASASVFVEPGEPTRIVILPAQPVVAAGGNILFLAAALDRFGNEVSGLTPSWSIVAGGGTIDANGVFTAGLEIGTFTDTLLVTMGEISARATIVVAEDGDRDGLPDSWESAHGLDPSDSSDAARDPDGDALTSLEEMPIGTEPLDGDSDDDGVPDGYEVQPGEDSDGDGHANALDPDSDDDGLFDGTEMGVTEPHADTEVSRGYFIVDADPATSSNPLAADTDGDGRKDGEEDANHDGRVDAGESDPSAPDEACEGASCIPKCEGRDCEQDSGKSDAGCGCGGDGASVLGLFFAVGMLRRRQQRV